MFKITNIEVSGFWGTLKASAAFAEDVNIIIGKNGTGKTTFMNVLQSVLSVDPEGLFDAAFESVRISLSDGTRTRTVRVEKVEREDAPFPFAKYQISTKTFSLPLYISDDNRPMPVLHRRRSFEAAQRIRSELEKLVSIASLNVHRSIYENDLDSRERHPRKFISPVDARLGLLLAKLTQYQLELSDQARQIASDLQRKVLVSLLYTTSDKRNLRSYSTAFDEDVERANLMVAYRQLGITGADVTRKINEHVSSIASAVKTWNKVISRKASAEEMKTLKIDLSAMEALKSTKDVVDLSLDASLESKKLFEPTDLFRRTVSEFIPEKSFDFSAGKFVVTNPDISVFRLSSGEKQLLILLIESLLQKNEPCIFLADEPELSLHISWQEKIIGAVRTLNRNAQIVVATHSPEVAGEYPDSLIDMEDIIHA